MASLIPISGIGGKLPACFLVEVGGTRLLLDLGKGPDAGRLPDVSGIGPVDAVVLTHAHVDHAGGLELLPLIGDPPVFATDVVASLLQRPGVRRLPLHGLADIAGVQVTTGRNGHAPGGVWLHLAVGDGLLYAGDISFESALYAVDAPPRAATAVVDASYGVDDTDLDEQRAALGSMFDGRPVLFPAPAGGRGPEIALHAFQKTGRGPALCAATRRMIRQLVETWDGTLREEAKGALAALLGHVRAPGGEPCGVTIAAKPNGDGGESASLIASWADRMQPTIVLTGHVAVGSPAEALVAAGRAVWQRWNVHPRLSDNISLAAAVGARILVPAFGGGHHAPAWRRAFAPAEVVLDGPIDLS